MLYLIRRTGTGGAAELVFVFLAIAPLMCFAESRDRVAERKWGDPVNGQAISIATDKARYAPGDRIILSMFYKNVGSVDMTTGSLKVFCDVEIVVLLPDGTKAPLTRRGQRSRSVAQRGSRGTLNFKPGQQIELRIDLSALFDLTDDGKYSVVVNRRYPDGEVNQTAPTVSSNTIEITVDERLSTGKDYGDFGGRWIYPKEGLGPK